MPTFRTPNTLTEAIYRNQPQRVDELLALGADPNQPAPRHRTDRTIPTLPLVEALAQGDEGLVRKLLDAGANPTGRAGHHAPMSMAIEKQRLDLVQRLHEAGADLSTYHRRGGLYASYLEEACAIGNADTVRWLIDQGADVRETRSEGFTLVHTALMGGVSEREKSVLRILRDAGADLVAPAVNGDNGHQFHPITYAAAFADGEVMEWFLDAGANPNQMRDHLIHGGGGVEGEHLPLLGTALLGRSSDKPGVCRALIGRGADLDFKLDFNTHTSSPCAKPAAEHDDSPRAVGRILGANYLMLAAGWSQADCVALLLERGLDANALSDNGVSALMVLAKRMDTSTLQDDMDKLDTLLAHGADPAVQDKQGNTMLHYLAGIGMGTRGADTQRVLRSIEALLASGADLGSLNDAGKSCVDVAYTEQDISGMHAQLVALHQRHHLAQQTPATSSRARPRF